MKPLTFDVMTINQLSGLKMIQEMSKSNSDLQQIYLSALAEVVWVKTNAELKPLYDVFPIPDNEQEKFILVKVAIHFNGLVAVNDLLFSLLGDFYQIKFIINK